MSMGQKLLNQVPNPFYGLIATGPLSGKTVAQNYLLRPFPQFSGFRDINPSIGSSIYHSFQFTAEKRFASGLSFLVAYTNQKLIDNTSQSGTNFSGSSTSQNWYDFRSERSVAVYDVSQRLVMSYVYELPIGRGRAFGKGMNRVVDAFLGGWQINGITTFQTGTPLLLTAANNANAFSDGARPNNNGTSAQLSGSIIDRVNNHQYFNTSVFSQPDAFTFGSTSRTLPDVRSPGIRNLDLSMFKNFKPMERLTVQFRAEAFNATNTVQFAAPGTGLNTPSTFGVISGQANSPRQLQFGLKLLF
jgi:hypothetical protein